MTLGFFNVKNKRYSFTSQFNVRLYKKCLSLKLVLNNCTNKLPNISQGKLSSEFKILKEIYCRKELVPLRLLRFFFLLNSAQLIKLGIKNLVAKKLSVYSGNKSKFININTACWI